MEEKHTRGRKMQRQRAEIIVRRRAYLSSKSGYIALPGQWNFDSGFFWQLHYYTLPRGRGLFYKDDASTISKETLEACSRHD
uniref:Uncharacterized protein n=2 Tax=Macaca TaxID=9539 RepID=A0A5F7ZHH9_MACMU|nr:unnamed protein product [Macaca fascicularis]